VRTQVVGTAAAIGAVAAGAFTALLPGTPAADPSPKQDAVAPNPVLVASEGVLPPAARLGTLTAGDAMQPIANTRDDDESAAAAEQGVASVEKAGRLAAQLAELHAREQRDQEDRARAESLIRSGGLDGWIAEALQVMNLPQQLAPSVKRIVLAESGGNPHAVNRWDSNARRGTPSRGLMQTIPSTFRTYVHPELAARPITDPVANITAGVRYMIDRYGIRTLQTGGRSAADGDYLGY
jgi:soluble lytic murein transglycosylase-like protein